MVAINTPFNIDLEFAIAGVVQRFLAWLIDTIIQVLYFLFYMHVLDGLMPAGLGNVGLILFLLLPLAGYHFLFELLNKGQSVGKMALGIRVVNLMGSQPSVSQLLIRLAFRSFTILPLFLYVLLQALSGLESGILLMLALGVFLTVALLYFTSPLGQRIGDRLADTIVIEKGARPDFSATIYQEVTTENYEPLYPEVMRLTDRDINGIRDLIGKGHPNNETLIYMERIAGRIEEVLKIQRREPAPFEFLKQLLLDYNYLSVHQGRG